MNSLTPQEGASQVALQMKKQLAIGGSSLEAKLRRGARHLPRHVRKEAEFLVQTARLSENPKLQRFVDSGRVKGARDKCLKYLKTVDKRRRRTDTYLSILNGVVLGILIPAGLFTTVLVWRGYL